MWISAKCVENVIERVTVHQSQAGIKDVALNALFQNGGCSERPTFRIRHGQH
jgi:hypothetical protein